MNGKSNGNCIKLLPSQKFHVFYIYISQQQFMCCRNNEAIRDEKNKQV
jgi:hypothetical protein